LHNSGIICNQATALYINIARHVLTRNKTVLTAIANSRQLRVTEYFAKSKYSLLP